MTSTRNRRRAVVFAVALITLTPTSPAFAVEPLCESALSPREITSVGISCRLAASTVVNVAQDLDVTVPEPGVVASVEVFRAEPSAAPSTVSLYRAADDQLALVIDEEPVLGSEATAATLRRILAARPERPDAQAGPRAAAPSWCGSTSDHTLHTGVWRDGVYPWIYNSRTQPDSRALEAIQYGFKFITDDSSACGSHATGATHDYRGSTTRYTWGERDNGNVVGWAGFGEALAVAYWWFDSSGYKLEGDIAFNNRITNWYTGLAGTPPSNRFDLISVATHEAGHIFGLSHAADPNQVMYYGVRQGANKRVKRSGDLYGMSLKY
jgi:hypothetical protein